MSLRWRYGSWLFHWGKQTRIVLKEVCLHGVNKTTPSPCQFRWLALPVWRRSKATRLWPVKELVYLPKILSSAVQVDTHGC